MSLDAGAALRRTDECVLSTSPTKAYAKILKKNKAKTDKMRGLHSGAVPF